MLLQAVKDTYRTTFYSQYLQEACKAITDNGLNVPVMFAWSLWDNFEWWVALCVNQAKLSILLFMFVTYVRAGGGKGWEARARQQE